MRWWLAVIAIPVVCLAGCRSSGDSAPAPSAISLTSSVDGGASSATPDVYSGLRAQVLAASAKDIGVAPSATHPHVWGVVMDWGVTNGTATLVALLDGTVSLYLSSGGGVIGAGGHDAVRAVATDYIAHAEGVLDAFQPDMSDALPSAGRVRFHLLTFDGTVVADARVDDLEAGRDPLSGLFEDANKVIAAIREATPPGP